MVKLTIIIPVYNGESYIENCVRNLEMQTYQEWKAIFVNDGSNDQTAHLLEKCTSRLENCEVIHQGNCGTASARNAGLELADSTYVTFMDIDDILDPHAYETMVQLIETNGVEMGICGYYFVVKNNLKRRSKYLMKKSYPACILKNREEIQDKLVDMWDKDILHNVWNKIYRLDLIREKRLRFRDGHTYTEDRVFNRKYIENCFSMAITDQCLYYYVRERIGSTSERYCGDNFEIRLSEYIEQILHLKAMKVWNDAAKEYVNREFIERIAGCLENIFHSEKKMTSADKKKKIHEIITCPEVVQAVRIARHRSTLMKILAYPIKQQHTLLAYYIYGTVYLIRKKNPILFHCLKDRR